MCNGVNVEELSLKAQEYDALAKDYLDLIGKYDELIDKLGKVAFYLNHVAAIYGMVKDCPDATAEDKLEFAGKVSGLMEAKEYILNVLKDCLGSEEEENDLPGEAEETEPSV